MARPFAHRDGALDTVAVDQRRHDTHLLLDAAPRAAAARRTARVQRFDFLADDAGFVLRRRARGNAQADLVRPLVRIECVAVQRRAADQVDAHFGELAGETLANDVAGELRTRHRVSAGVADLAFADEAGEIANAHLEPPGPRMTTCVG